MREESCLWEGGRFVLLSEEGKEDRVLAVKGGMAGFQEGCAYTDSDDDWMFM